MQENLTLELETNTRKTLERALHCYFIIDLLELHPRPEDAFIERMIQLKILLMQEIEQVIQMKKPEVEYINTNKGLLKWKSIKFDLLIPIYMKILDKNNSSIMISKTQYYELGNAVRFFNHNFLQNLETDPWIIKQDYQAYLDLMNMRNEIGFWERNAWEVENKINNLK